MLEAKNKEIKQLTNQIEELEKISNSKPETESKEEAKEFNTSNRPTMEKEESDAIAIADRIMYNKKTKTTFNKVIEFIQGGFSGLLKESDVDSGSLAFLEANDVVENSGERTYKLTTFGKKVLKYYTDQHF